MALQDALMKPNVTQQAPDPLTDEANAAQEDAYKQLSDHLNGMTGVDFEAKFRPLIEAAQSKAEPKVSSPLAAAVSGFGAPGLTENSISQQVARLDRAKEQKAQEVGDLQREALKGSIQQELDKGNFQKALKQSEVLGKLHETLDTIAKKRALQDYKEKTDYLFGQKGNLEDRKAANARDLVSTKVREYAKANNFDDKMTLKLLDLVSQPALLHLHSMLSRNPLTGEMEITPEDAANAEASVTNYIANAAATLRAQRHGGTAPSKPAAPTVDPNDPLGWRKK